MQKTSYRGMKHYLYQYFFQENEVSMFGPTSNVGTALRLRSKCKKPRWSRLGARMSTVAPRTDPRYGRP